MTFPLRPLLFRIEPERAHAMTIRALELRGRLPGGKPVASPRLGIGVAGIDFPNPLGLAAGADKDARAVAGFLGMGLGSVEVGTLTPRPQAGNPRPRLFRLVEDRALVNRLGFNNGGLAAGLARVAAARRPEGGRLGVNVGANKDSTDRVADYASAVAAAAPLADWVTINVSSPNTPGLRDLQHGAALAELLAACDAARVTDGRRVPLFLKVAPDLDGGAVEGIAEAAVAHLVDALVVGNTTLSRPGLSSRHGAQAGGLSGAALAALAATRLRDFARVLGHGRGPVALVAAGGVGSGAEAYARIRAGASLVQLYTALVYGGPGLPRRILGELEALLTRDGATVGEAVGADLG